MNFGDGVLPIYFKFIFAIDGVCDANIAKI